MNGEKRALFALDGLVHMRLTHVDVNDETELFPPFRVCGTEGRGFGFYSFRIPDYE